MRVFYVRCSTIEQNEARQLKMAEEQKPKEWSKEEWEDYKMSVAGGKYSKGGKLKKRRGGLTY